METDQQFSELKASIHRNEAKIESINQILTEVRLTVTRIETASKFTGKFLSVTGTVVATGVVGILAKLFLL